MALNYVSGTAEPQPVIMADVTIPLGEDKPDQVDIELVWNGTDTISQSFDSVGFDPGTSVRVAIPVE